MGICKVGILSKTNVFTSYLMYISCFCFCFGFFLLLNSWWTYHLNDDYDR